MALLLILCALAMAALGNTVRDALLNWFRGTTFTAAPSTIYLAAFTVNPSGAGGGTEVAGGAYARVVLTLGAPSAGAESNPSQVAWATATANWGTVTALAVMDAPSGGNLLAWAPLGVSKVVNSGNRLVVDPAQLGLSAS